MNVRRALTVATAAWLALAATANAQAAPNRAATEAGRAVGGSREGAVPAPAPGNRSLRQSRKAGSAPVAAPSKAKPPTVVVAKRSLSIPVNIPPADGQPASAGECIVTAGPAIPISALAFSPDGKTLAVGGYREVLLWDLDNAKLAKRIAAGQLDGQVRALAFSKEGKSLAVADGVPGASGSVAVIELETGEVARLEKTKDEMISLAFSPDNKFLAAGGVDGLVRLWGLPERKPLDPLRQHTDRVSGIAFSPNGKLLATASIDKTVQIWEAETWKPLVNLPQPPTESVHGVAFSPENDVLAFAVGGPDERAIRIWRTENAEEPKESDPPAVKQRRRETRRQTRPLDTGTCLPLGLIWPPLATGGQPARARLLVPCTDNTLRVVNANGGGVFTLSGHSDWVYSAAATPDVAKIASGSGDGTVKLWSGSNGTLLATLLQISPRTDEWLIVTPRGYFATSTGPTRPGRVAALSWKAADPKVAVEELSKRLENAEAVRDALAGKLPAKK